MIEEITEIGILSPDLLIEMFVAIICGGLIGLERGIHKKTAGLRDNILICLGSTLYMNISELVALNSLGDVVSDPGRIAAQVVTGIGFIGAGVIIRDRGSITGLTTAATLWIVAAIGLIIGSNQWLLALLITGISLLTLTLLNSVEKALARKPRPLLLKLIVRQDTPELRLKLKEIIERAGIQVEGFRADNTPVGVRLTLHGSNEPEDIRPLIGELWTVQGVIEVEH